MLPGTVPQTNERLGIEGMELPVTLPGALPLAGRPAVAHTAPTMAGSGLVPAERKRVEAVVEALSHLQNAGESLEAVAHDARNMVTALGLYCELLEEPGVLTAPFRHYAGELRLVATASRRLVEKLLALDSRSERVPALTGTHSDPYVTAGGGVVAGERQKRTPRWEMLPAEPIDNLAGELVANRNLLSALAGPAITIGLDCEGGALPVRLTGEDLTRILVNLVKNAAEAMSGGGRIDLVLRESPAENGPENGMGRRLALTVEDNGPGIPHKALEKIFESGYTTHPGGAFGRGASARSSWPAPHRGLGLSITRSIVEAAGGGIHAAHRAPSGARFVIELPVRGR